MERFSVPKCDQCGSDLDLMEVLVPSYDDGGGLDSVEVDYVITGCDTCYHMAADEEPNTVYAHWNDELPF